MSTVLAAPAVSAPDTTAPVTLDDHRRAFTEISFLLDAFAAALSDIMGGATVSVGRSAGRQMARKLPDYLPEPTLEAVLDIIAGHLRKGFEMTYTHEEDGETSVRFERCAIRQVCRAREKPVGGDLCRIFHNYLDGVVCELLARPTRSTVVSCSESCRIRLEMK
jgi:hypothetical protein